MTRLMLVGIYMPPEGVQRNVPPAVDGLETEFLRRAIRGAMNSKTKTDVQFVWFSDDDSFPMGTDIPCVQISRPSSLLHLVRGGHTSLDEALAEHGVDVLLTRIDTPPIRSPIPKVLFTLDMYFHGDIGRTGAMPAPTLPKKIKQVCLDAKGILCPSEYIHKTCASRLEMGLEKAIVARPGVDGIFSEPQESIIEGPFALFVLNRYTEPAIPTLLTAIRRNKALFPPNLVVLGSVHPSEPDHWELPVVRIERCPDNMVASLMQHAGMCIYPARGEGSGMTVLQAMTAGAMLVTSKLGANFEVAGSAPFYCEPDNPISLLQVLRRMLDESPGEREKRRQMARSLVIDNTWERCGSKIVSALKRSLL